MIYVKMILAAAFAMAFGVAAIAADDSPTPTTTTSPGKSRSGTLIQTDIFPDDPSAFVLNRTNRNKFEKSHKALRAASARFQRLAKSANKGMTPRIRNDMNNALRSLSSNAAILASLARQSGDKAPRNSDRAFDKIEWVFRNSSKADIDRLLRQVRKVDAKVASLKIRSSN